MKIVGDIINQRVQLDTETLTKAGEMCIEESMLGGYSLGVNTMFIPS